MLEVAHSGDGVTGAYPEPSRKNTLRFCEALDWFFGCLDVHLGVRSTLASALDNLAAGHGGFNCNDTTPEDVPQRVRQRLRVVSARFSQLSPEHQVALQRYYEGRSVSEATVCVAHEAFYATKAAA